MEIKKSSRADLERHWLQRFMLGLIVALAGLFVSLEYNLSPDDPLEDPELLEQLGSDEEFAPLSRDENEVVLVPKSEPEPTTKLKVVEEDQMKEDELVRQPDQPVEGELSDEQPLPDEPSDKPNDEVLSFRVVEDLPQFPGGYMAFVKWLTQNLKYPSSAEQRKLQGKVVAEFIVNKDGSVTDVRIITSLHPDCDNEALRVLRMMPRWTAGVQNDKPCRTKVCIPIVFKL